MKKHMKRAPAGSYAKHRQPINYQLVKTDLLNHNKIKIHPDQINVQELMNEDFRRSKSVVKPLGSTGSPANRSPQNRSPTNRSPSNRVTQYSQIQFQKHQIKKQIMGNELMRDTIFSTGLKVDPKMLSRTKLSPASSSNEPVIASNRHSVKKPSRINTDIEDTGHFDSEGLVAHLEKSRQLVEANETNHTRDTATPQMTQVTANENFNMQLEGTSLTVRNKAGQTVDQSPKQSPMKKNISVKFLISADVRQLPHRPMQTLSRPNNFKRPQAVQTVSKQPLFQLPAPQRFSSIQPRLPSPSTETPFQATGTNFPRRTPKQGHQPPQDQAKKKQTQKKINVIDIKHMRVRHDIKNEDKTQEDIEGETQHFQSIKSPVSQSLQIVENQNQDLPMIKIKRSNSKLRKKLMTKKKRVSSNMNDWERDKIKSFSSHDPDFEEDRKDMGPNFGNATQLGVTTKRLIEDNTQTGMRLNESGGDQRKLLKSKSSQEEDRKHQSAHHMMEEDNTHSDSQIKIVHGDSKLEAIKSIMQDDDSRTNLFPNATSNPSGGAGVHDSGLGVSNLKIGKGSAFDKGKSKSNEHSSEKSSPHPSIKKGQVVLKTPQSKTNNISPKRRDRLGKSRGSSQNHSYFESQINEEGDIIDPKQRSVKKGVRSIKQNRIDLGTIFASDSKQPERRMSEMKGTTQEAVSQGSPAQQKEDSGQKEPPAPERAKPKKRTSPGQKAMENRIPLHVQTIRLTEIKSLSARGKETKLFGMNTQQLMNEFGMTAKGKKKRHPSKEMSKVGQVKIQTKAFKSGIKVGVSSSKDFQKAEDTSGSRSRSGEKNGEQTLSEKNRFKKPSQYQSQFNISQTPRGFSLDPLGADKNPTLTPHQNSFKHVNPTPMPDSQVQKATLLSQQLVSQKSSTMSAIEKGVARIQKDGKTEGHSQVFDLLETQRRAQEAKRSSEESSENVKVLKQEEMPKFFVGGDPTQFKTVDGSRPKSKEHHRKSMRFNTSEDVLSTQKSMAANVQQLQSVEFIKFKAVQQHEGGPSESQTPLFKPWNKMPSNRRSRSNIHPNEAPPIYDDGDNFTKNQRRYFENTNSNFKPIQYLINDYIRKDFKKSEQEFLVQNSMPPFKGAQSAAPNDRQQDNKLVQYIKREQEKQVDQILSKIGTIQNTFDATGRMGSENERSLHPWGASGLGSNSKGLQVTHSGTINSAVMLKRDQNSLLSNEFENDSQNQDLSDANGGVNALSTIVSKENIIGSANSLYQNKDSSIQTSQKFNKQNIGNISIINQDGQAIAKALNKTMYHNKNSSNRVSGEVSLEKIPNTSVTPLLAHKQGAVAVAAAPQGSGRKNQTIDEIMNSTFDPSMQHRFSQMSNRISQSNQHMSQVQTGVDPASDEQKHYHMSTMKTTQNTINESYLTAPQKKDVIQFGRNKKNRSQLERIPDTEPQNDVKAPTTQTMDSQFTSIQTPFAPRTILIKEQPSPRFESREVKLPLNLDKFSSKKMFSPKGHQVMRPEENTDIVLNMELLDKFTQEQGSNNMKFVRLSQKPPPMKTRADQEYTNYSKYQQKMKKRNLLRQMMAAEVRESKSSIESHTVTTITNINDRTHFEDSDGEMLGAQNSKQHTVRPDKANFQTGLLKGAVQIDEHDIKDRFQYTQALPEITTQPPPIAHPPPRDFLNSLNKNTSKIGSIGEYSEEMSYSPIKLSNNIHLNFNNLTQSKDQTQCNQSENSVLPLQQAIAAANTTNSRAFNMDQPIQIPTNVSSKEQKQDGNDSKAKGEEYFKQEVAEPSDTAGKAETTSAKVKPDLSTAAVELAKHLTLTNSNSREDSKGMKAKGSSKRRPLPHNVFIIDKLPGTEDITKGESRSRLPDYTSTKNSPMSSIRHLPELPSMLPQIQTTTKPLDFHRGRSHAHPGSDSRADNNRASISTIQRASMVSITSNNAPNSNMVAETMPSQLDQESPRGGPFKKANDLFASARRNSDINTHYYASPKMNYSGLSTLNNQIMKALNNTSVAGSPAMMSHHRLAGTQWNFNVGDILRNKNHLKTSNPILAANPSLGYTGIASTKKNLIARHHQEARRYETGETSRNFLQAVPVTIPAEKSINQFKNNKLLFC